MGPLKITEKEKKDIHKQYSILNEALGVPSNIIEIGKELYHNLDERLTNLNNNHDSIKVIDDREMVFHGNYNISDFKFNRVLFTFKFIIGEKYPTELVGMAYSSPHRLSKEFEIETKTDDSVNIVIKYVATNLDFEPFLSSFKKLKPIILSSIVHELKHSYDYYKKPSSGSKTTSKYLTYSNNRFGKIKPLNEFMFNLYFTHSIENLVRPSEVMSRIDNGEITKKDFLNFLKNDRVYTRLIDIRNFSYGKLKNELLTYVDDLRKLLKEIGDDVQNLTDDEIITKTLNVFVINISNWTIKNMKQILTTNIMDDLIGFEGNKELFFSKFINRIQHESNNPDIFFAKQEKFLKFASDNMIKKISKLYDMVKDDINETTINNPELWNELLPKSDISLNHTDEIKEINNKKQDKIMGILKMTDEERKAIHKSHVDAEKRNRERVDELKKGLQKPEDKK